MGIVNNVNICTVLVGWLLNGNFLPMKESEGLRGR